MTFGTSSTHMNALLDRPLAAEGGGHYSPEIRILPVSIRPTNPSLLIMSPPTFRGHWCGAVINFLCRKKDDILSLNDDDADYDVMCHSPHLTNWYWWRTYDDQVKNDGKRSCKQHHHQARWQCDLWHDLSIYKVPFFHYFINWKQN